MTNLDDHKELADAVIAELQVRVERANEYARIEAGRKGEAYECEGAAIARAEKAEAEVARLRREYEGLVGNMPLAAEVLRLKAKLDDERKRTGLMQHNCDLALEDVVKLKRQLRQAQEKRREAQRRADKLTKALTQARRHPNSKLDNATEAGYALAVREAERLKVCGNCAMLADGPDSLLCDHPVGQGASAKWYEVYPYDHCRFAPSRWKEREP